MKCAVVTPVGPGHESDYASCRQSIEAAWAAGSGPFKALEILPMWDLEGRHGRSARRNDGIEQALAKGCDWIFFLDADDLMVSWAFERFAKYADAYDAVWGLICENVYGTDSIEFRDGQLPATDRLADILTTNPVFTLQMGHFVRTSAAAAVKFDVDMNCGEDFKYYLGLWQRFRCAKVEEVFFINRRGNHSSGPRSADGPAWQRAVEDLLRQAREEHLLVPSYQPPPCDDLDLSARVEMKRSGDMWIRAEDTFMPMHFDITGDGFEIDHLLEALKHCPSRRLALDVGAHYGSWTRHLARRFTDVLAFEPIPETFACLERNTRDFPNARIFQKAVGEAPGHVSVGRGKMYEHPGMETVNGTAGEIEMIRIDDLNLPILDFLKIDVEGYELHVLRGAEKTLRRFRPVVLFEENIRGPLEHGIDNGRCAAFLEELGARLVCSINKDFVFKWPTEING